MDFGKAIEAMKSGKKVAREGWNGKGMFIYTGGCSLPFPPLPENEKWLVDAFPMSVFVIMKTADNNLIPWLASQTDILAEDWQVVE